MSYQQFFSNHLQDNEDSIFSVFEDEDNEHGAVPLQPPPIPNLSAFTAKQLNAMLTELCKAGLIQSTTTTAPALAPVAPQEQQLQRQSASTTTPLLPQWPSGTYNSEVNSAQEQQEVQQHSSSNAICLQPTPTPTINFQSGLSTMLKPMQTLPTTTSLPMQKLNIEAFQADREISAGEAIMYCLKTKKPINVNDGSAVVLAVSELGKLKKLIKDTAQSYLIKDILVNSRSIVLPDGTQPSIRCLDDLLDMWSKHESLAEQIWTLLIKRYKDMGEWEVKFEEEVMQCLNLEYVEDDAMDQPLVAEQRDRQGRSVTVVKRKKTKVRGAKGCVARLVTLVKRDLVKRFNGACKETHKTILTSVNPSVTINEEGQKEYKKQHIKSIPFNAAIHLKKRQVCTNPTNSA